jgi:hypothetical protein
MEQSERKNIPKMESSGRAPVYKIGGGEWRMVSTSMNKCIALSIL